MNIAVRYYSRTVHTQKVAEAIGQAVGTEALTIDVPIEERIDILFLGSPLYYEGISAKMREFIRSLDREKVGRVYIFSTTCLTEFAYPELSRALKKQGISVAEENFQCWGEFNGFYVGKPDENDLNDAKAFARAALEKENGRKKRKIYFI